VGKSDIINIYTEPSYKLHGAESFVRRKQ